MTLVGNILKGLFEHRRLKSAVVRTSQLKLKMFKFATAETKT